MSARQRKMLEDTLFNLIYDMEYIGGESEIYEGLAQLTDSELEVVLNDVLTNLDA